MSDAPVCVMYAGSWCEQINRRRNIDVELKLKTTRLLAPNSLTKLATQISTYGGWGVG